MDKKFVIILGVSGSGKTTVIGYLKNFPVFKYICSYVTRKPRKGENNGDRYFFIDKKEFEESIKNGEFIEYALVHKLNYYGTKKQDILQARKENKIPIKEMDIQGLEKVLNSEIKNNVISLFLDIPEKVMIQRIKSRGEISQEELNKRLQSAKIERQKAKKICNKIIDATQDLQTELQEIKNFLENNLGIKLEK